jgi:type I restriction enzyme M protein
MPEAAYLHCPLRGTLNVRQRAKDGLTFTEEKARIDALRFLLQKGYPRANFDIEPTVLRFGHKGHNSLRPDFSVYDEPADSVRRLPEERRLDHVRLIGEVKRDHADAEEAKATQIRPVLKLLPDTAFGVYWDDIEQRLFYRDLLKRAWLEAPLGKLPTWGASLTSAILSYSDLKPAKDLLRIFDGLEDALHPYITDKTKRYAVLLQLLLLKIHDENSSRNARRELALQDFTALPLSDREVARRMNAALDSALNHYQRYLPKKIDVEFNVPPEALRRATELLAPVKILESRSDVIQKFYMKFAKDLYKWDLAQYFTPHEVIDFIVDVVNPQYGEHVKDPACGSADFLVSAFRSGSRGVTSSTDYSQCIWGSDNSEQAVQISILNMLLNGDGKSNIREEDSLEKYSEMEPRQFEVVLCNPPFGTKIVERRWEVLRKFDMGYAWTEDDDGQLQCSDEVLASQQTGILFAELCVRLARPGGRVGIILPNGYLGNSTARYVALREWLLRHARLVGIASFPRFTFKKSGADVSASVVFLEARKKPLESAAASKGYRFFVGMIEAVGWRAGDKKAVPVYRRDPASGDLLLSEENEPLLDTDFPETFQDFVRSAAGDSFSWLRKGRSVPKGAQGWSVDISEVVESNNLPLDPKRWCPKYWNLVGEIQSRPSFALSDVLDLVPEKRLKVEASRLYRYVEIQNLGTGSYDYQELRGWQLPARARLTAEPGDIFIAAIWGSAGKWCLAGKDSKDLLFTNGCVRVRIKEGKESYLLDLVAGLCSEAFCVQMRALATGSDGLAEISEDSLLEIHLPRITDASTRARLSRVVEAFQDLDTRLDKAVLGILAGIKTWPKPPDRKSHCVLV